MALCISKYLLFIGCIENAPTVNLHSVFTIRRKKLKRGGPYVVHAAVKVSSRAVKGSKYLSMEESYNFLLQILINTLFWNFSSLKPHESSSRGRISVIAVATNVTVRFPCSWWFLPLIPLFRGEPIPFTRLMILASSEVAPVSTMTLLSRITESKINDALMTA